MTARVALAAAERGTKAWRTVVATQGTAIPDEPDFQPLTNEIVETLRALQLVAGQLLRQVHGYGITVRVLDDEDSDPAKRLVAVAAQLSDLHCALVRADRMASGVCAEVEHLTIEVA
jgi:hypothetical protein